MELCHLLSFFKKHLNPQIKITIINYLYVHTEALQCNCVIYNNELQLEDNYTLSDPLLMLLLEEWFTLVITAHCFGEDHQSVSTYILKKQVLMYNKIKINRP